jgi:hypothetical protein
MRLLLLPLLLLTSLTPGQGKKGRSQMVLSFFPGRL